MRTLPWIGICLATAFALFAVTQLFRTAPVFIGAGFASVATIILLLIVPVFTYAMAPSCLIAVFAAAGKMHSDNELCAVDALGISRLSVVRALMFFLLLAGVLNGLLWLYAVPATLGPARTVALDAARTAALKRLSVGQFNYPAPGLAVFAQGTDAPASFTHVFLEWQKPESRIQIFAENATFHSQGPDEMSIRFTNGRLFYAAVSRDDRNENAGSSAPRLSAAFKTMALDVPIRSLLGPTLDFLPETLCLTTAALAGRQINGISPTDQRFALWRRIAGPVGFLSLTGFGVFFAFFIPWKHRSWAVLTGLSTFGAYHLTGRWTESTMTNGLLSPPLAALLPAIVPLIPVATLLIGKLRSPSSRAEIQSR